MAEPRTPRPKRRSELTRHDCDHKHRCWSLNPELAWQVTKRLVAGDSPMTISIELAQGLHGYTANISHETIYQGVYAPKRHGLPTKVYKMLHRRRPRRRHTGQRHSQQRSSVLGQFNIIHNRPPAAEARAEVGHLEGDQIIGARNQSAIITLVDRKPGTCGSPATTHPTVPTPL
ncbi:MAG: IS30 family transposase [Microthrixaceae bacterium]|nr:IS30 family transposase [Microthrixaceae bacterium]